jgi:hypothetical protein
MDDVWSDDEGSLHRGNHPAGDMILAFNARERTASLGPAPLKMQTTRLPVRSLLPRYCLHVVLHRNPQGHLSELAESRG